MTFLRLLLIAPLLTLLAACSSTRVPLEPITIPANLRAQCPALPQPPSPLIDPERLEWEVGVVLQYEECRTKHRRIVSGLPEVPVGAKP